MAIFAFQLDKPTLFGESRLIKPVPQQKHWPCWASPRCSCWRPTHSGEALRMLSSTGIRWMLHCRDRGHRDLQSPTRGRQVHQPALRDKAEGAIALEQLRLLLMRLTASLPHGPVSEFTPCAATIGACHAAVSAHTNVAEARLSSCLRPQPFPNRATSIKIHPLQAQPRRRCCKVAQPSGHLKLSAFGQTDSGKGSSGITLCCIRLTAATRA